ncbi:MAG TPA: ABC transporter substrate-binding protein [Actinomycetota bacterium]|nr:ABC transporter substrate-binding protein [Actinomycetota bacterium]
MPWRAGHGRARGRLALVLVLAVCLPACIFTGHPRAKPASPRPTPPPGDLRIGIRPPTTLDPALRVNPSDLLVAEQIFEPLVGYDRQTYALVPKLAERWEVQDNGTRFVFHLRPDARFQNGVTVTAGDVAFALNRLAQKATDSSLAYLLKPVQGFDDVNVSATATSLSGVQALDPHTLQITITSPWVDFPYVLTDPATAPLPADQVQADPSGFMKRPVGSGPYELTSNSGLKGPLTLRRSPDYWGPAPAIPEVTLVVSPSPNAVLNDLHSGRVDVGEVPPDAMSSAVAQFGSRGFGPLAGGLYLGFNLQDPAVSDPRLREAVSFALDRKSLASQVYGNVLTPATSIVPPGLPGHSDLACATTCTYQPDQARALVKAAFPNASNGGPSIAFDYPAGGPSDALAQAMAADLKAVGITLQLRPHSPADYLAMLNSNSQEMFLLVWVADYPLADWFLTPLFSSQSLDNHTGYSDGAVQYVLHAARGVSDTAQSLLLYRYVEGKVLSDMAVAPIGFYRNHDAADARVHGFYVDLLGGFEVSRLSLAP